MEGWGKKREIHRERDPLKERHLFEQKKEWSTNLWERDIDLNERETHRFERERETNLRKEKFETFEFYFLFLFLHFLSNQALKLIENKTQWTPKHQNISNPKHQDPLRPKPSNQQTQPTTHNQTQLIVTSTTTNHHPHGRTRQKERSIKREKFIWGKERVKHWSLRERHRSEWERDPPV